MPPRKGRARQTGRDKAATTKRIQSTCSTETHPNHPKVPEPVSESGSKEDECVVSPPPSDDSASKSESQMSEDGRQSQKQKKKKTKTYTHLTIAQQEAMVDWLKTHEVLYNKELEGYKDTKKKAFLWQKQAELMGVDVDELKIWYNSLRTCYTKLKKMKSGDGAPEHTDRNQWVLNNFSFLARFTYEVKKRTLVTIAACSKIFCTNAFGIAQVQVTSTNSYSYNSRPRTSRIHTLTRSTDDKSEIWQSTNTTTTSTNNSRSSTPKQSDLFSSAISGKMDQFMEMQNRLMHQMVRPNTDRMKEVFVDYIRESVYEIHPHLWEEMHRDIMKIVLMNKDRDNELKRGQQQRTATATTGWQPAPHMWPSTVQNPVSVWESTESTWVNQQFPQHQQFSQQQQSQQLFKPQQQQPQNVFQPQQPTSSMQQQRPPDKQQGTPLLNTPQFTPMDSTPDSSFCGLSSLLVVPSLDQQQGQQQDDEQEDPL